MKAESTAAWRDFICQYERVHIYTVDPGAHAIARELVPLIRDVGRLGAWCAEGWSAVREPGCRTVADVLQALALGDAFILNSQTNFVRTQQVLRASADRGAVTIFLFDHWKNFAEHFGPGPLPDIIIVPDQVGRELAVAALGDDAAPRVRVLPHLAIEAAAHRVMAYGPVTDAGIVALLLDPTEPSDGLGYDWRVVLGVATGLVRQRRSARLCVKPHPRQDVAAVQRELDIGQNESVDCVMFAGDTEQLIAIASEVWGMTTTALNVALAAGKPIRSFQPGRTPAGARASNPHIEPYVIV